MAVYNELNPIRTVDNAYIPVVSGYTFNVSDVSDANAGRTEDTAMHKNMLGSCVHIGLEWTYLTAAQAVEVMTAFAPEYISVQYLDVRTGTYVTSTFYSGDKSAVMAMTALGARYTVNFNIIERTAN